MDFTLTPEQQLLADGLGKFLDARYDLQASREAVKVGAGWQPEIWRALADELGVTKRTIARDIERLIHSGVPIIAVPGRGGGVAIENDAPVGPIELDLPEIAALMASLAAVGPTVSASAASAMNKLATALSPAALSPSA